MYLSNVQTPSLHFSSYCLSAWSTLVQLRLLCNFYFVFCIYILTSAFVFVFCFLHHTARMPKAAWCHIGLYAIAHGTPAQLLRNAHDDGSQWCSAEFSNMLWNSTDESNMLWKSTHGQTWDLSKNLHDRRFQGKKITQKTRNFRHLLNRDKKCVNALNWDKTSKKCSVTM